MNDRDRYSVAVEQVRFEGHLLWQIFGAFLLAQTVFLAFLLPAFSQEVLHSRPSVFISAFVGLLLCVPWFATYRRSSDYYCFRMAQARELEPEGWNILRGDGVAFSDGKLVLVGDKPYRVHWVANTYEQNVRFRF
jgi:hypothetical protein